MPGNLCEIVVISSSNENERGFMQGCRMGQGNKVPTQRLEIFPCFVGTCLENIFCPSLPVKSKKKLNLPKTLLLKLQPFFVDFR